MLDHMDDPDRRARLAALAKEAIASELRAARAALGITQPELAARSGISVNTIVRYEGGQRSPDATQLIALAEALETSAGRIVDNAQAKVRRQEQGE